MELEQLNIMQYLPYLIPFGLLSVGLLVFAWIDIARKKRTKNLNIIIWVLITLINTIGPLIYLVFGRAENIYED